MNSNSSGGVWGEYCKQLWQGAKDVILSTKTMMLMVNAGNGTAENFHNGSSQVAKDTKNLIVLMFQSAEAIDAINDTGGGGADPSFTKQFLTDTTRSLKSCVLNLIKACKDRIINPEDDELRVALNHACKKVGEVLKDIMMVVQPVSSPRASVESPPPRAVERDNSGSGGGGDSPYSSNVNDREMMEVDEGGDNEDTGAEEDSGDSEGEEEGEQGEELDFVVNALNVFGALDDLRGELKLPSRKNFTKASNHVMVCASSLVEAAQTMKLSQSISKLKGILESLVQQIQTLQTAYDDVSLRTKLDKTARDLEEAVGGCVDEFRALGNGQDQDEKDNYTHATTGNNVLFACSQAYKQQKQQQVIIVHGEMVRC
jgi:hypothetical protein